MTKLQIFTMEDWKTQVLSEEKPVLVDFQAPWCAPALIQYDSLLKLAEETREQAKLYQMDISRFLPVAMAYRLIEFPTLSLFHKGRLLKSCIGMGRIQEIKNGLSHCLGSYVRS